MKNDLLLRALKGLPVERPPVWIMRQAGRYLPDYIKLKNKYDFFTRCKTPELVSEITLLPINQIGTDAAIIFSDILVVLQAMNIEVEMKPNFGPFIPNPIDSKEKVKNLITPNVMDKLGYVFDAIKVTKRDLNDRVPLIGFAGSPWPLFCYLVQGSGSKTFDKSKGFAFANPKETDIILEKITLTTIEYLKGQIDAGADVVQIFDSWGGLLSPSDYSNFSLKYINRIVSGVKNYAPVIIFGKGCWFALNEMAKTGASGLGIDWSCSARNARYLSGGNITLQGNYDPAKLLSPISKIKSDVHRMINDFGKERYIVNLGHGILPNIPVSHAKAFVDSVKEYQI